MNSIKFAKSIIVESNIEHIFDFTQDYNKRLKWDTFLKKADLIGDATIAHTGVKAYCIAKNGLGMETQYITYNRPKVTAIKMTKGPFMFKAFLGSWTFKKLSKNRTEVVFLYAFTLRFPFSLLTRFIKNNLESNVKQRLIDLKNKVEEELIKI